MEYQRQCAIIKLTAHGFSNLHSWNPVWCKIIRKNFGRLSLHLTNVPSPFYSVPSTLYDCLLLNLYPHSDAFLNNSFNFLCRRINPLNCPGIFIASYLATGTWRPELRGITWRRQIGTWLGLYIYVKGWTSVYLNWGTILKLIKEQWTI